MVDDGGGGGGWGRRSQGGLTSLIPDVMSVVGLRGLRRKKGRLLTRYSTRGATVPRVLFTRWRRLGFWGCRGARNAGRGALPTAGKREGISF